MAESDDGYGGCGLLGQDPPAMFLPAVANEVNASRVSEAIVDSSLTGHDSYGGHLRHTVHERYREAGERPGGTT